MAGRLARLLRCLTVGRCPTQIVAEVPDLARDDVSGDFLLGDRHDEIRLSHMEQQSPRIGRCLGQRDLQRRSLQQCETIRCKIDAREHVFADRVGGRIIQWVDGDVDSRRQGARRHLQADLAAVNARRLDDTALGPDRFDDRLPGVVVAVRRRPRHAGSALN